MAKQKRCFFILVTLLAIFCLRVVAQILVAFCGVTWLPSMEEWYSGVLSYPIILCSQFVIITVYSKVCFDFAQGKGFFVNPNYRLGLGLVQFGWLYLGVMVIRYVIQMSLYPQERWMGGSLPTFLHWVLASFILVLGYYHLSSSAKPPDTSSLRFRIRKWLVACIVAAGILLWSTYLLAPSLVAYKLGLRPSQYAVRAYKHVPMSAHDGVQLVADVYRPQHIERTPTVLVRIAYSKSLPTLLLSDLIGRLWAERGYTVVLQGARGRYESGGKFYPLIHERSDGIDTLNWVAKQPWFNGQIVTWGGSTSGYSQWVIADQPRTNEAVVGPSGMTIYLSSTDFYRMFYPSNAFSLYSALSWATISAGKEDLPDWPSIQAINKASSAFPLRDCDLRATGKHVSFFQDWLKHSQRDSYWLEIDGQQRARTLKVPVLLLCGWYDPFLSTEIDDYIELTKYAVPAVAAKSQLIIGPWTHAHEITFPDGKESENFRAESIAISLPWFDRIVNEGKQSPQSSSTENVTAPVKIFVMGTNKWRNENEWPLARTKYIPFYLSSKGKANSLAGDGLLSTSTPQESHSDSFEYDPNNPVPTTGGAMLGKAAGMFLQNQVESRPDILVYTSAELDRDIEVTGPIKLHLIVSTSAPCTDFTAKLLDVFPDGRAYNLSDGIVRRSYSLSPGNESSRQEEINIAMPPTSNVFFKGHRIRLEISSSNFPRFDRNTDTGGAFATETKTRIAKQTIYHSIPRGNSVHFSELILPIVN